jgi:hypothetical protein
MSTLAVPPLPDPASPQRLVRATLTAAALAGVLLVTVVLPAEYGIDPTGIGRATGLYRAPETAAEPLAEGGASAAGAAPGGTVAGSLFKSATPYRSDEMSLTLAPGEGAEIKAQMNAGERLVFSWTSSGGGVDVDMHGEAADKTGGDRSYWTGEFEAGGHGAFEAPMTGNHGWFWQNLNDTPVTITVKTSGFYRRLFKP